MAVPAADELFTTLRERVFRLCLRILGTAADAEDATQEVFVAVHRGLRSFRGESSPATWVHRIALREALRLRARRGPRQTTDEVPEQGSAHPEGRLAARHEARRVTAAFDTLSAEDRSILAMFTLSDVSHPEIAEALGVPEGTIWSRLHAARQRLRAAMERGGR
jgi:RNA polymerase sigma-70 factor (ECF subfamily)